MHFANRITTISKLVIGIGISIAVIICAPRPLISFRASACTWVTTSCGSGCSDNKDLYNCSSTVSIQSVTASTSNPDANAKTTLVAPPTVTQYVPATTATPEPSAATYIKNTPGQTVGSDTQTIDQTGLGGAVKTSTGMVDTTVGTTGSAGTSTGDNCNPGKISQGIWPDIRCGSPYCGASYMGQECGYDGKWSTTDGQCVRAHACGYVSTGIECDSNPPSSGSELVSKYSTCQELGYASTATCNKDGKCVTKGGLTFSGCGSAAGLGTGDKCWNCYSNGQCYKESSSCGANVNCRTTPAPAQGAATVSTGGTPSSNTPPFVCLSISKDISTPTFGQSVRFTCGTVSGATSYEFQYKVDKKVPSVGTIPPLKDGSNLTQTFAIKETGTYKVQCRPCKDNQCAPWSENW